jgi:hypothetical protein
MRLPDLATTTLRQAATLPPRVAAGLGRLGLLLRGDDCPPRDGGILVIIGAAAVWAALLGMQGGR